MCTYVLMISRYYNELSKQFLSWNARRRLKYHSLIMFKKTEKIVFIWWKTKCTDKSMSYTRVQLHNISANWYICSWDGIFLEKGICFVWMAHLKTVMERSKKKVNLYMWRRKQKDQNALIIDRFSAAWKQKLKTDSRHIDHIPPDFFQYCTKDVDICLMAHSRPLNYFQPIFKNVVP